MEVLNKFKSVKQDVQMFEGDLLFCTIYFTFKTKILLNLKCQDNFFFKFGAYQPKFLIQFLRT